MYWAVCCCLISDEHNHMMNDIMVADCNDYGVGLHTQQGDTAAHNAMRSGCSECIRVLLNYGADFDIRNKLSQTPIDIAESLGNQRCLNAMHTAAGAASTEGRYIHMAVYGQTVIVCVCVCSGVSVN